MAPHLAPRLLWSLTLRRLMRALCLGVAILLLAALANVIGIRVVGDLNGWEHWLTEHRAYFLLWRLALYAATGCGWWWMRKRVVQREPNAHLGLRRAEITAVTVVLALELVAFLGP